MIEWSQKEKRKLQFLPIEKVKSKHEKQYIVEVVVDGKMIAKAKDQSIKGAEKLAAEKAWTAMDLPTPA